MCAAWFRLEWTVSLCCVALLGQHHAAQAQVADPLELVARATPIISDFATEICQDTDTTRMVETGRLTAEAEARITGLFSRLADIGGGIKGELLRERSDGVLVEDLPKLLAQQRDCRERVFNVLIDRLVPLETAPRDGDPGTRSGEGAAAPNAFLAFSAPEVERVRPWDFSITYPDRTYETVVLGEEVWYRMALIKRTQAPLMNCRFDIEMIGPQEWVAEYENWDRRLQQGAVSLDGRESALEFPGETRIALDAGIKLPREAATRPAHVDVEIIVACANYDSPPVVVRFPIPR